MTFSPIIVFVVAFALGCVGGLWSVTSGPKKLSWRLVLSTALGSGCVGLGVSLLLFERYGTTEAGCFTVLGIALILGMAGKRSLNILLKAITSYIGPEKENGYDTYDTGPNDE